MKKKTKKLKKLRKWCYKTKSFWKFENKKMFIYFCSNSTIFGKWDFS